MNFICTKFYSPQFKEVKAIKTVYCISERPLEKIEERHTEESESEAETVIR